MVQEAAIETEVVQEAAIVMEVAQEVEMAMVKEFDEKRLTAAVSYMVRISAHTYTKIRHLLQCTYTKPIYKG